MTTNVKMLFQEIETGKTWDIASIVNDIQWSTELQDQPSKLEVSTIRTPSWKPNEGDIVRFEYEGAKVFYGKVFTRKKNSKDGWSFIAYDRLRYLQNQDTLVLQPMTSGQVTAKVCNLSGLPMRIVSDSGYACPKILHDNKSYYSMIDDAIGKTIIQTGNWYYVRDNFGTIEHLSLLNTRTNLVLGDESLLTDYDFESTIDDSFNTVKITKENKETSKREVYMVYDSNNQKKWGKLQFYKSVDEGLNYAQIVEFAHNVLKSLNVKNKTLKLNAIGNINVRAGTGIYILLKDLAVEGFSRPIPVFVTSCKQSIGSHHSMQLTVKVV